MPPVPDSPEAAASSDEPPDEAVRGEVVASESAPPPIDDAAKAPGGVPPRVALTHPLVMSYLGLRRAIGISGLALPVALGGGGLLLGIPIQDDMSSYYHTGLRDVFVGTLCAIGIFLLCYRGHDWVEDWTANVGCVGALALAFFPIDANSQPPFQSTLTGTLHTLAGGVFFLTLAFYSLVLFPREPDDDDLVATVRSWQPRSPLAGPASPRLVRQRNVIYRTSGLVILGCLVAMGVYLFLLPANWQTTADGYNVLFWLEWVAVWAFAAAWLTKGRVIGSDLAVSVLAAAERQLPEPLQPTRYQTLAGTWGDHWRRRLERRRDESSSHDDADGDS